MFKFFRIGCVMIVVAFASVSIFGQNEWAGRYEFSEDGGKNAGGTAIFVQHELEIVEGDDGLIAFLKSNGYQTSKDLICTVKITGGKLSIFFESYGEDNVFEPYESGDLLLTLERKAEKGKTSLLTHWGKFTPIIAKNEKSGKTYFTRSETTDNEK
jgi:hypothetical protein